MSLYNIQVGKYLNHSSLLRDIFIIKRRFDQNQVNFQGRSEDLKMKLLQFTIEQFYEPSFKRKERVNRGSHAQPSYLPDRKPCSRRPAASAAAAPARSSPRRTPAAPRSPRRTGPPRPSCSAWRISPCPRCWGWWSGWEGCPSSASGASGPGWPDWWPTRCARTRTAHEIDSPAGAGSWPRTPAPPAATPRSYSTSSL